MTRYRIRFPEEGHVFNGLEFHSADRWHTGWMRGVIVDTQVEWSVEGIYLHRLDPIRFKCECELQALMRNGCNCGSIERYRKPR